MPGVGWARGCVVKWGAERGVRINGILCAVKPREDERSTALAVTQIERRVFGLHLILGVTSPLVVVIAGAIRS